MGKKILISGGGIAGLTLAILLKEKGYDPAIVERDHAIRTEGYVIDFFSTGWDVAQRMGLVGELQKINYPIDSLRYVDANGKPYPSLPIARVRNALDGKYIYMRRSDLERILFERAKAAGVTIRFGTTISSLEDSGAEAVVTFDNGAKESFELVFGADGVHSRVRELAFGLESQFKRFLGYYVAAFHLEHHHYEVGTSLTIYEEPERSLWVNSLGANTLSAMYVFRHGDIGNVPPKERVPLLRKVYHGAGWIAENILADFPAAQPIFFDSASQIGMPTWSKGRVALLGDACACLTLLAGQGSHLAMAEAYVIATELERHAGDHCAAFAAYEEKLKPATVKKQQDAVRIARFFVPSMRSIEPLSRTGESALQRTAEERAREGYRRVE
jgi:2-polyprenyl-6-methoxyphenol hydroxylase-like FAD-dependent oxidoreductase